ncbi:avidin-like [Pogoniulus pusillus]|uniref:avidin-like n=1 Tax=Pogoniulus pusillus TaxID=488313 RepID=UPI0030B9A6AF
MVQVTPFLLLLCLALVAPGLSSTKCVLTGKWINDLGSNMVIEAVNKDGSFKGTYNTSVSDSPHEIKKSPLLGYQQDTSQNDQTIFGFTVNWTFSDSITVFTGQCLVDENGKELLKTMWLLRSHVDDIQNDWKATRVGTNVFERIEDQED